MINFLDVAAPSVEPVSDVNKIIVISILAILIISIFIIGYKMKDRK